MTPRRQRAHVLKSMKDFVSIPVGIAGTSICNSHAARFSVHLPPDTLCLEFRSLPLTGMLICATRNQELKFSLVIESV
jgi:hypothetical protein